MAIDQKPDARALARSLANQQCAILCADGGRRTDRSGIGRVLALYRAQRFSTLIVPAEDVALVNQQPVSRADYLALLQTSVWSRLEPCDPGATPQSFG